MKLLKTITLLAITAAGNSEHRRHVHHRNDSTQAETVTTSSEPATTTENLVVDTTHSDVLEAFKPIDIVAKDITSEPSDLTDVKLENTNSIVEELSLFGRSNATAIGWKVVTTMPFFNFFFPQGIVDECKITIQDPELSIYNDDDQIQIDSSYLSIRFSFLRNKEAPEQQELGKTFVVFRPLTCYNVSYVKSQAVYDRKTNTMTMSFNPVEQPLYPDDNIDLNIDRKNLRSVTISELGKSNEIAA